MKAIYHSKTYDKDTRALICSSKVTVTVVRIVIKKAEILLPSGKTKMVSLKNLKFIYEKEPDKEPQKSWMSKYDNY